MSNSAVIIMPFGNGEAMQLPFVGGIAAGFPSPANDYLDATIDLNVELVRNPSATFIGRVSGLSMKDAGISDKDLLIVDKSLEPRDGKIAVCYVDGEFTLKRISIDRRKVFLMPANPEFEPIEIGQENDFMVWGIVTYVIKKM